MIPVVYCLNDRISEGLFLSATSVARRTKESVKVYVCTMDYTEANPNYTSVTDEHVQMLDVALKRFNGDNCAVKVDLSVQFKREFDGSKNLKRSYTPYTLLRLLLDDESVFPEKRAIYLDVDTMTCGDIADLWNVDVSEAEYAASLDALGKIYVKSDYCNAGVLLLNLDYIRRTGLFAKARMTVYKHSMFMPDQTAIYRNTTAKVMLPRRFNEQRKIFDDTVVRHFNRFVCWFPFHLVNIKQWERDKVHSKLKITCFDIDYDFYDDFMAICKPIADNVNEQ